jgi:hypothetical protein
MLFYQISLVFRELNFLGFLKKAFSAPFYNIFEWKRKIGRFQQLLPRVSWKRLQENNNINRNPSQASTYGFLHEYLV